MRRGKAPRNKNTLNGLRKNDAHMPGKGTPVSARIPVAVVHRKHIQPLRWTVVSTSITGLRSPLQPIYEQQRRYARCRNAIDTLKVILEQNLSLKIINILRIGGE